MNLLDSVIGFVSPRAALRRARARHALRIYEGAATGRRGKAYRGRGTSANTEIQAALVLLRDRAHDLVRNMPHAKRALDILVTHIVGTGIRPVPNTGSDRLNDKVEGLWDKWQKTADVEGVNSFYAMQVLAVRSMIEAGECVIRLIDRKPTDVKTNIPLRLQLLESDFIDGAREGVLVAKERARLGVGLGEFDMRTGLWLWPRHPGELVAADLKTYLSVFVPSDEVIHLFTQTRPGQVRGVTWLAPIMTTAREFSDFMDAVNVKARVEACFAAFITQADEIDSVFEPDDQQAGSDPNAAMATLEPGMMKVLKPGQNVAFANPTSTSQVETIMMFNIMAMAAALGCTYDQMSGDLRQANYSSLRAGKIDFQGFVEQIQETFVIPRLCERVWDRFIERAILAGELKERRGGYPCEWVTPAFQSVNPKFDQDAEERSVRAGRMTPQQFIASWGGNWRKQLRAFKEFYDYANELGVKLDIDVEHFSRAGLVQQMQQAKAAGGVAGAESGSGGESASKNSLPQEIALVDANGEVIDLSDFDTGSEATQ